MNIPRSTLRRRRFIQSSSALAFGAAASVLAGRKLFNFPFGGPDPDPALTAHEAVEGLIPDPDLSEPAADPAPNPAPVHPLSYEEEYTEFLTSLDLRHLSPHEIIDPHRAEVKGVANSLPPQKLWEKLIPTLRVADEIRERLELPLCRITSAYRCPKYNAVIPGAAHRSYHTRNQALDLVYYCSTREAYKVAVKLRNERFFKGGIGLYSTFIHIDTRGYAATWRKV